ncbi:MAG TPA: hypothetical protein VLI69_03145 [Gammaproteobacteria bacterium]|nr:hypothetical protein [Gammaproteobacteria bacterium]
MAAHRLNEIASLINNQIDSREQMHECLLKAEALAHVALSGDFLDRGQSILNEYLGVLFDFILESKTLNQAALDDLIKCSRQGELFG